ncbi:MAG: FAD-dependent oxidoreductase [Nitrososphaeria archaeon]
MRESEPAKHSTSRNTGVVHRPFFLPPDAKATVESWIGSYHLWRELAIKKGLKFEVNGQLEVARDYREIAVLRRHQEWARLNGMEDDEIAYLEGDEVRKLLPESLAEGALMSRSEANVNYGELVEELFREISGSVKFIGGFKVESVSERGEKVAVGGLLRGSRY